uniref:Uncharacterized protein n=1 Tax=Plectus sambesii TaxID=2011161 RepID=A0A914V3X2_9BILA
MNSTIVNAVLVIAFAACVYSQCDPACNQKCKRGNPLSTGQINSYGVCWCTNRAEQPCNVTTCTENCQNQYCFPSGCCEAGIPNNEGICHATRGYCECKIVALATLSTPATAPTTTT